MTEAITYLKSNQSIFPGEGKPIRGFIFACTDKSERECFERLLFATDKMYGSIVTRIRKGDILFLNNVDTDTIYGIFMSVSDGGVNIDHHAFNGRYPYQVKVEPLANRIAIPNARKILAKFSARRNTPLFGERLLYFLDEFRPKHLALVKDSQDATSDELISKLADKIRANNAEVDIEEEIPLIESTTFWDFPKQSYGITKKGNNKYPGVTPALIIYNMIWRYTDPGDLVVDPMCGSGTTIDVCLAEKRKAKGYDIVSTRPDIIQNDARKIPLEDNSVDMVFIDSPYGDNIKYNNHPDNIGNISAESENFYDELEKVMVECHRILKDGKALGWLIGDQWVKREFTPVGFGIYDRLCKYFEPVDIICVNRRSQSSNTDVWHNRARRFNFYLRGFKYLLIVRKTSTSVTNCNNRKIQWAYYERSGQ
ncbi:MAG TPA: DNA methylase [Dehalococcoidia bacterium]|nr:DNA methylase [Dehalococcoidia bacterium]